MNFLMNSFLQLILYGLNAYVYVLLLRVLLEKNRVHFFNQGVQVLVKLTDFMVRPMRKVMPYLCGFDTAGLALAVILQFAIVCLGGVFLLGDVVAVIVVAVGEMLLKLVNIYFYAILMSVLMSWLPALAEGPLGHIVYRLCEPLMYRVRCVIPPIAGLDLSAIPILIVLRLIGYVVFQFMLTWGMGQTGVY